MPSVSFTDEFMRWLGPLTSSLHQATWWGIGLCFICFIIGNWLYQFSGQKTIFQPVVAGILLAILSLLLFQIDYHDFAKAASPIHFLLSTATVALALPLYNNLSLLRRHQRVIGISIVMGSAVASLSAIGIGWLARGSNDILLSLAPKSITTPFAISVSETIGGIPSLTAAFVIITGIFVAVIAPPFLRWAKVDDELTMGTLMGMTGHGIATASAFTLSPQTGAFSALSMCLTGTWTAIALPYTQAIISKLL